MIILLFLLVVLKIITILMWIIFGSAHLKYIFKNKLNVVVAAVVN